MNGGMNNGTVNCAGNKCVNGAVNNGSMNGAIMCNEDGRKSDPVNDKSRDSHPVKIEGRDSHPVNVEGRDSHPVNNYGAGSHTVDNKGTESHPIIVRGRESYPTNIDGTRSHALNTKATDSQAVNGFKTNGYYSKHSVADQKVLRWNTQVDETYQRRMNEINYDLSRCVRNNVRMSPGGGDADDTHRGRPRVGSTEPAILNHSCRINRSPSDGDLNQILQDESDWSDATDSMELDQAIVIRRRCCSTGTAPCKLKRNLRSVSIFHMCLYTSCFLYFMFLSEALSCL